MSNSDQRGGLDRRHFLQASLLTGLGLATQPLQALAESIAKQPFSNGERELIAYPQKRPLMRITTRPPHLETPFEVFNEGLLTPNDAFYVRYHLANIPTSIDTNNYRITVRGCVNKPLDISLDELKKLGESVEVVAVSQCSGNSRGYFTPRVFGAQLGNGSMGNARWVGLPLRTLLEHAGVQSNARQVTFRGMDRPVLPVTPTMTKSLDVEHALSPEPLIAWSMNGEDLPMLNGYPIRLVVPGYYATYWTKHLSEIEVIDHEFQGFFMQKAYRVPDNECECLPVGSPLGASRPISRLWVRSFITSLRNGQSIPLGQTQALRGIAFDGGSGIRSVEISDNGGRTWQPTRLGESLGNYSFREWRTDWRPKSRGIVHLQVRARNNKGETQPAEATWNPGGYARHSIETLPLHVI
ncbi:TPA: molybdopterin-dependent oxidoreductase [Pseudomonas aeruginosa]|nr:molybdopterin-dependent oxidoreductase [Pseudomonas aeruginosa]HBO3682901.1 molybdopterin-dependent oxidoreductase [Pseudomonas aeruginosa]HBO3968391.1 molybdopterin-dependent oxidoreductase [Pseudomonas aeruginosa]HCD6622704.1 molybdopterin-dependent oxidoreductase [Pseudomonas aeruginosa]HCR1219264.1 molybdopterin-dependent oxidoreductase [Pseudomonas aeruginosa]